jgi:5-methyltetrahydrofolate--homocysteine methyltransferase
LEEQLIELKNKLISGSQNDVSNLVKKLLDGNSDPQVILNRGLIAGMDIVGEKFEKQEYFIPQVLLAARAMKSGMSILKPFLVKDQVKSEGKVVIGTVKGDIHDIGKNLVAIMLEGAGFEVHDLGTDVPAEKFVQKAFDIDADVIAMSSLITTSMSYMRKIIDDVKNADLGAVKTVVGGAPVSEKFAHEIGATGHGKNATDAVRMVKSLLRK